jgi:formylglycine-generating enzyme
MGTNPSKFQGDNRRPIDSVSREDVQIFLKKLNEQNDGYAYRLPTEAEWEYAARAGTAGMLYGKLDEIAWYGKNSDNKTHPIGQKKPNGFGLYDMIGNVWEMCSDWEDASYYVNSPRRDPQGPSSGRDRILRQRESWRCKTRDPFDPRPPARRFGENSAIILKRRQMLDCQSDAWEPLRGLN